MSLGRSVGGRSVKVPQEAAYTRLEADASADNPYSFIAIFRRCHLATRAGRSSGLHNKMCTGGSSISVILELSRRSAGHLQWNRDFCGPSAV